MQPSPLMATAAILLAAAAFAQVDYQHLLPDDLTPEARRNRESWFHKTQGENLALGRRVQFAPQPTYRLTRDENDPYDLTDGKLTARKDDRMWFHASAVGWTTHPFNLMVDLGEVQPIERVLLRFLGGREQDGLRFPRALELVVSVDGENFYRAGEMVKLNEGEKDQDGEPGVFYRPEEGRAYAYPLGFTGLRTKARYVGLTVHGDKGFVFADEMAVIKGDFPAEEASYEGLNRVDFLIQGVALRPRLDELAVSTNIYTPNFFFFFDARESDDRDKPVRFTLEVPAALSLAHAPGEHEESAFERDGRPMRRFVFDIRSIRYNRFGPFYFRVEDQEAAEGATAVFMAESEGYEPQAAELPIRTVAIPEVGPMEKLHVSLAWMSLSFCQNWPDFFDAWEALGFNVVATFPRNWRDGLTEARAAFLNQARERGMKILYNESPFHVMVRRRRNEPEIYSQVRGEATRNACPSYRGQFYQEEIERVGDCFEMVRPDYVFHDIELWWRGAREAPRCSVCQERLAESGKELDDYLTDLGTEMVRDMSEEIARRAENLGLPMPRIGSYNVHAARPIYHSVFDFRKLYPHLLQFAQPSLYVKGSGLAVHETIRGNYQALDNRDTIPWLTAGTYGEFEPWKMEPMILEAFLNGAKGITYYAFRDFDTPMDFYYHAMALKHLKPFEGLLEAGRPVPLESSNPLIAVSAYRNGDEMLLMAANYQRTPNTKTRIALPFAEVLGARDLRADRPVRTGAMMELEVEPEGFYLFHVRGRE